MNEEKRINDYFGRVKQNPPLIEIKKVHQILNNAEVKAKVEKGHRNLLRFSIMTSIFAIVLCTIMFWPKAPEEIRSSKEQIPKSVELIIDSASVDKDEVLTTENELIVAPNIPESAPTTVETTASEKHTIDQEFITLTKFKTSNYSIYKKLDDKSCDFQLILFDKDEFFLNDKNNTIWLSMTSDQSKVLVSGEYHHTSPKENWRISMSFFGRYYIHPDSSLLIIDGVISVDTSLANHSVDYDFILENNQRIAGKYVPVPLEEKTHHTEVKKDLAKLEYPEQILDSTLFIDLNRSQLENIGFKLNNDAIELFFEPNMFTSYRDGRLIFGVKMEERQSTKSDKEINKFHFEAEHAFIITKDTIKSNDTCGKVIPMLVTNQEGENLLKMAIPELKLKVLFSQRFEKDFKTILPVVMKKGIFGNNLPKEDIVFWFLPTDELFNKLPRQISEELLAEYEYITAEDKSVLVQPECKYFDECKNTLNVSSFKVFPNPATSNANVTFSINESIDGKISLVDLAGRERMVLQPQTTLAPGSHRFQFDVSEVPEGIYLITLSSDRGIQTQRFIVTH